VAVKVLYTDGGLSPDLERAVLEEVRAVAGLEHPGIVALLDHGLTPEDSPQTSQGRIAGRAPWLAMELASGGALAPFCRSDHPPLPWRNLRALLLALLDALAHAHARGVVHRDLKPANILLCTRDDLRPGPKLSDFGLARVLRQRDDDAPLHRTADVEDVAGTLHYMAPEQIEGAWRDFGAWTDLYGLGCIAFELATGRRPYAGETVPELIAARVEGRTRPWRPRCALPRGLGRWVARLLEPSPRRRFRRAADAAWALIRLPPLEEGLDEGTPGDLPLQGPTHSHDLALSESLLPLSPGFRPEVVDSAGVSSSIEILDGAEDSTAVIVVPDPSTATLSVDIETVEAGPDDGFGLDLAEPQAAPAVAPGAPAAGGAGAALGPDSSPGAAPGWGASVTRIPIRWRIPPMAGSWRRPATPRRPMRLVGAGLALFRFRELEVVGRESERDALWRALREVREERAARAVIVQGPAGFGRSRLARWLCERAHELGAATSVDVVHGPRGGPRDGIPAALRRHLRLDGMPRERASERLEQWLLHHGEPLAEDPSELRALLDLLVPPAPNAPPPVQFSSPADRYELMRRVVLREARERPVVLNLDDVQWGAEALGFALHLLADKSRRAPVLMLLSVREDALPGRPEQGPLSALLARPRTRLLPLAPLPPAERPVLVRELLRLQGDLAGQLERRSAGNPLLAVQIVADWVARGVLEPGDEGFRLRPGTIPPPLPQDLRTACETQIGALLDSRPDRDAAALELAALLGGEVDRHEWEIACEIAGLNPSPDLVDEALRRRLLKAAPGASGAATTGARDGFSFVHGMLRESLEERAKEKGRAPALHRACAAMLGQRGALVPPERFGRHLLLSGEIRRALGPLLLAARERLKAGDRSVAEALLAEREAAMTAIGLPSSDPAWGQGLVVQSALLRGRGRLDAADDCARRAWEGPREAAWAEVRAEALVERAHVARERGELEQARDWLESVEAWRGQLRDRALLGSLRLVLGRVLADLGQLDQAEARYKRGREEFESAGDRVGAAACTRGIGMCARHAGRMREAEWHVEQALALYEEAGSRSGIAASLNDLGELARLGGRLAEAEERYRAALRHFDNIGSSNAQIAAANLGLVLLERGQLTEARPILREAQEQFEAAGRRALLGITHVYLLPCAAAAGDWEAWDLHAGQAMAMLAMSGSVDPDIARIASTAAEIARKSGQLRRARQAWILAREQWSTLGRSSEAERLDATLRESDETLLERDETELG
jgi:serine/threonine protein kinase/tetratricopeptide (TPR) repeat protein